ncbi:lysosomal proton-coupled steroid conjugate and bile acid symporter SLC46A3-like [Chironomus tepperi]|uniref:lysosomal proton-coupled steroid conjugate and bile acid symporter SLC46A3-like n=1 Tax=Chironomus tepperi TaxID=113505 RepID=UPI00391F038C
MRIIKILSSSQRQKIFKFAKNVTVEPLLPLYIIASVLTAYAAQNLYLDKACRVNLGYSDEICDALRRKDSNNLTHVEIDVQKVVVGMQKWKIVIQSFIPCLLILFVGSWSDRHGRRKPCMLIPIFGELVSSAGLALNVYFKDLPMEVAGITEALFEGITGGWATMLMGAFSYIADITNEEDRTLRIGIANTFFSIGLPIAMGSVGILLRLVGYYGVFLISTVIHLIAFIYALFWIKESSESKKISSSPLESPQIIPNPTKTKKNFILDFFDPTNPIETFKIVFVRGQRLKISTLLFVVILVVGPMHGEQAVMYLYTRLKFNWNEVDYSFYYTFQTLITMCGTITTILLLSTVLKIHDALIGAIGSISKILASFIYAFAVTSLQFYFGPVVEFIHYASFIAMRSIASKIVGPDERARLNSLVGLIESLAPSIYGPMYSKIYDVTITVFPGAFYLVGSGLKVMALMIFIKMYISYKRRQNVSYDVQDEAKDSNRLSETEHVDGKHKTIFTIGDVLSLHVT